MTGFPALALQLGSSSDKTFSRVDKALSWYEAQKYCRLYHTDLADVESLTTVDTFSDLYSALTSTSAWVGIFYDEDKGGLSWSSGSTFISSIWTAIPGFREGICGTIKSVFFVPNIGVAMCTHQKPFICYYDPAVGQRMILEPTLAPPKSAEVQIGQRTFTRFNREKTWLSALKYCREQYTDLADLQQVVSEADKQALKSITDETEAWMGLFFNASSKSMSWSSGLGHYIPNWLTVPKLVKGLCAGLRIYVNFDPKVYAVSCFSLRPFICFYEPDADPETLHPPTTEAPNATNPGDAWVSKERVRTSQVTTQSTSSRPVPMTTRTPNPTVRQDMNRSPLTDSPRCNKALSGDLDAGCTTVTLQDAAVGTSLDPLHSASITSQVSPRVATSSLSYSSKAPGSSLVVDDNVWEPVGLGNPS
ncbi:PREDICTED: macrophage mannose receptor 1-like [Elephantulus edwardii]|uniref:macrophage mannose receptor 1-like n=1 Tax=Elephantulus edwardii TaxID=28737 RepID=UPI0003F0B94B|nr:PREDICTED: macrophage mannose receptor 1-like [Elephantulus edwardii]